jgi:hypothetical protein
LFILILKKVKFSLPFFLQQSTNKMKFNQFLEESTNQTLSRLSNFLEFKTITNLIEINSTMKLVKNITKISIETSEIKFIKNNDFFSNLTCLTIRNTTEIKSLPVF